MRSFFAILTVAAWLCAISLGVRAESLNATAVRILTESPNYKSQDFSLQAAQLDLATSSNLPDPELKGEYLVLPSDVDNRWTAELSWGVEWPGVYNARSNEAKSQLNAAQLATTAKRLEQLYEIKLLLIDYVECSLKLKLLDTLNQNNDSIFHLAEQAARGGEMTVLDLNKVKLEYANIRSARALLIDQQSQIIAELSQTLGKDCTPLIEAMDCDFPPVDIPTQEQISAICESAPEILCVLAEAESARKAKSVAKMEALPSISLGYKHAFEDGMHFNGATFGISLPIFSSRGKQKAVNASIAEAEFTAEAKAAEIEAELLETRKRLVLLEQQINEISPLIENADYNSALLKAYKGGVLTLIEYISDRNYFTTAALEFASLRASAAKSQTALEKYFGYPSEENTVR